MDRIETEATIGSADSTSLADANRPLGASRESPSAIRHSRRECRDSPESAPLGLHGGLPSAIDCLTDLEGYYQSRYEYYLAMATEAKENRERVRLLLLDLGRDALTSFSSEEISYSSKDVHKLSEEQREPQPFAPDKRVNLELPQTDSPKELESAIASNGKNLAPSVSQMKEWTLSLAKAMSIIESVSNEDSDKTLHQNYLHHVIEREFEQKLSSESIELYLEEAIRRGFLELDEFNNDCYRAKPKNNLNSEVSLERSNMDLGEDNVLHSQKPLTIKPLDSNVVDNSSSKSQSNRGTNKVINKEQSQIKTEKLYNLPESDKLKHTLFETIEEYIALNHPKRFSIDDVINYLYSQDTQLNWNKTVKNKVRTSISNVLSRKTYLNKYWTRIKLGVYRPLTKS